MNRRHALLRKNTRIGPIDVAMEAKICLQKKLKS